MTVIDLHAARPDRTYPPHDAGWDGEVRWPLWRAALLWIGAAAASWWGIIAGAAAIVNALFD